MNTLKSGLLIIVLILAGCVNNNRDQPDNPFSVEIKALGNLGFGADAYSCSKDCYNKLITKKDTTFFINSIEDYSKLIMIASCLEIQQWPDVDFSKNSLLAGVTISSTSCASIVKETLVQDPSSLKYTLIITLQQGSSPAFSAIFYWMLADKIPVNANVSFEVKYSSIQ
jgi:hypothetical protein